MIQYLGGAGWGLVVRRPLESAAHTLWLMAALFIPIGLGLHSIYEWSHGAAAAGENEKLRKLLEHKSVWLNPGSFRIRALIYFAIWIALMYFLRKWSQSQDKTSNPNEAQTWVQKAQNLSGPGFLIYGLTVTFASVDWVMSLDAEWFSTIFGLLTVAGQGVLSIAFLIAVCFLLSKYEPMAHLLKPKHFHDLGKLQLATVMVWAYFSFSQLLIIWAGNLPEEIPWYLRRFQPNTPWRYIGIALILLQFALPFLLLLSRDLKKRARQLIFVACLLICMRLVDLIWVIAPELARVANSAANHPAVQSNTASPHINIAMYAVYVAAAIGMGGIWLGWFFWQLRQRPLIPPNDPQLAEALAAGGIH
jgi:magnesium-transporting ATPase (P-type)